MTPEANMVQRQKWYCILHKELLESCSRGLGMAELKQQRVDLMFVFFFGGGSGYFCCCCFALFSLIHSQASLILLLTHLFCKDWNPFQSRGFHVLVRVDLETSSNSLLLELQEHSAESCLPQNIPCSVSQLSLSPSTINNFCLGILFRIGRSETRHGVPVHMSQKSWAQWCEPVKVSASKTDCPSSIPGTHAWKERTDSCKLASGGRSHMVAREHT